MAVEEEPKFETPTEEQKPEEEGFKKEGDLWVPKEERGHIRSAQEVERAREEIPEEKKIESEEEREERKEREWKYGTRTLERIRRMTEESEEDKKEMESAKAPEKGVEAEDILKEVGAEKKAEEAGKEQEKRKEKISSMKDIKEVGKERLNKLVEGLSYVAAIDKLGILGLKKGKKLAVEGGKDLAAIGLTPAAAVEEAGRYVAGRIQIGEALRKSFIVREKVQLMEKVPAEKRPAYFNDLFEKVLKGTEEASEELMRGYDKIYKKGRILRLIEMLGGKVSKPIGKTFGPPSPSRQEKI